MGEEMVVMTTTAASGHDFATTTTGTMTGGGGKCPPAGASSSVLRGGCNHRSSAMAANNNDNDSNEMMDFERLINGETDRLVSRTSNLLQNKSFTDVTFIVGPASHSKKYVGHRVLLAMTSPVFEAMFYGDMSMGGDGGGNMTSGLMAAGGQAAAGAGGKKVIRIPDLAPIGFENLLRYAYTDSLNLNSVEDAMLTAYAAKKYLLPHLLRECLSFVDKNVSPASACSVLEFSHVLHSQHLTFQALQVIDRNTYQVLGHKSLAGIQAATMATIASRPYLNLYSESSLVTAAVTWACAEARRRGGGGSSSNRPSSTESPSHDFGAIRSLLQESGVLQRLRFLSLTPDEFAKVVLSTTTASSSAGPGTSCNCCGNISSSSKHADEVCCSSSSSLLTSREQIAVFMNISVPGIRTMPASLCPESRIRSAPPDHFVVRRFARGSHAFATATPLSVLQSSSQNPSGYSFGSSSAAVKAASCKFQVMTTMNDHDLVDLVFIVGAVIPIRLDPSYYSVRVPRLDVSLRFTSKPGIHSSSADHHHPGRSEEPLLIDSGSGGGGEGQQPHLLTASLSKDKDCVLRLKRPLVARRGNLNEIVLTLAGGGGGMVAEDLIVLRSRGASTNMTTAAAGTGGGKGGGGGGKKGGGVSNHHEVTDDEGLRWIFFKPSSSPSSSSSDRGSGIEFNELFYYY